MGEILLVAACDGVVDFGGSKVFPIAALEVLFGVVGDEDFDAVEEHLFEGKDGGEGDGNGEAPLADFKPLGEKEVGVEGKDILELLSFGMDGEVIDVDHRAAFADEYFNEALGMLAGRPILDEVFSLIEFVEGVDDIFKVVLKDGDVDVFVPGNDAAIAVGPIQVPQSTHQGICASVRSVVISRSAFFSMARACSSPGRR